MQGLPNRNHRVLSPVLRLLLPSPSGSVPKSPYGSEVNPLGLSVSEIGEFFVRLHILG